MADDTIPVADLPTRRERLRARRRRARAGTTIAIVVVIAGSVSAYAFTRRDDPAPKQAAHARTRSVDPVPTMTPVTNAKTALAPPRAISHDAPLKLWVGGDSLAGELGPALGTIVGNTGVVHTQVDYMVSSGLASNDVRNWYERAQQQMALYDPEAVVFEIGTNDASIVNDQLGADGVPKWESRYRFEVARMMDLFRGEAGHRRTVYWVGAPTMRLESRDKGVKELDRVAREEAAKRAPDVVYIDAYSLFAVDGTYSSTIRTVSGEYEQVRISDGVHLTTTGADYLAMYVFAALDQRWRINAHADHSQPITWDESKGSSGNGGYSGTSGSSSGSHHYRSGSGSYSTTPNTPAPPPSLETTAPPTATPVTTAAPAPVTTAATAPATTAPTTPPKSTPPSS